jgi:hypothetical protein
MAASDSGLFRMRVTFSTPVELPGVGLAPGSYVFERPLDGIANMVRVRSADGRRTFLTAFTDRVARPADLPPQVMFSFAEAPANQPQPITTWWPSGADHGYSFRYDAR